MEFIAQQGFIETSPRKVRVVVGQIKKLPLSYALAILKFWPKKVSSIVRGTLLSASSNAKAKGVKEEELVIKEILVNAGSFLKRVMPRARGQADRIKRRSSLLKVVLAKKENKS